MSHKRESLGLDERNFLSFSFCCPLRDSFAISVTDVTWVTNRICLFFNPRSPPFHRFFPPHLFSFDLRPFWRARTRWMNAPSGNGSLERWKKHSVPAILYTYIFFLVLTQSTEKPTRGKKKKKNRQIITREKKEKRRLLTVSLGINIKNSHWELTRFPPSHFLP